jgi:hypothetical protein
MTCPAGEKYRRVDAKKEDLKWIKTVGEWLH